ncbi:DEAD/DEAH box helicase [Pollutimonas sp. M17]|uniref:DEAD/DEAH box helicase n=1 Tax=Pollutimonas sp. M17 TaxID=2962065 RepID=UPI0021F4B455|nr:DEAD/DEAH box helicase family protein [Pollutimonas sp. M17]UYO94692.1 DEAD/DEAH box helicase family protein [Pollutimonas sp. M17]
MSRIDPLLFQERHIDAIVARFQNLRDNYNRLTNPQELGKLRKQSAAIMLQAPTGIGKTLIATEAVARFSVLDDVVWFWFAPYSSLIDQAAASLQRQAPQLKILNIEHQRTPDELASGALFVITWQTVATKTKESRLARSTGDAGLSVDDLIIQARALGLRVGVVVDEAHHGFVKAKEAYRFFSEVLEPDYALMMTATPRDEDIAGFADKTGYQVGDSSEWATITRFEGYQAGLLKLGVKTAQFLTGNNDDAALVDFEEVAMSECAAMHRHIKSVLADAGIGLTPLMLVQVPNGGAALEKAREYLTGPLKFPESAVKVHVAEEPDPNLQALAQDPTVEVLVFKMAIAMGFDAPRAFTLAALRGTRDANFGIQVVGRIMRVHSLLQRRPETPQMLNYGYVFLANREAQEGLAGAATVINKLQGHTANVTPETVVTFTVDSSFVQVVKTGQTPTMFPLRDDATPAAMTTAFALDGTATPGGQAQHGFSQAQHLFPELAKAELAHGAQDRPTRLVQAFRLDAEEQYDYPLTVQALPPLVTEVLPVHADDFEAQLVSFLDFTSMLADRDRSRTKLVKRTVDIFEANDTPDDADVWARMSAANIAQRARQIAFEYPDVDRRSFLAGLLQRFRDALEAGGFELPETDEELTQQLELVLVRNPNMIRQAHKRCRASQIQTQTRVLPPVHKSKYRLEPAKRNVYGVFPADLSAEELRFAEILDTSADVQWWHRNPVRQPESVALYRWSSGIGFFPDFLVAVKERKAGDGVALVEFKGPQLQQYDKEKAGAVHMHYGRVFMVGGSGKDKKELRLFRLVEGALVDDGLFEVGRLRYE